MGKKCKVHALGFNIHGLAILLCFLACVTVFLYTNGCAKPYGLSDVDASGSMKAVKLVDVSFSSLLQATLDVFREAGLEVVEELKQPDFNVYVIKARSQTVGTVKVRITSLSETSHELVLFTSSEEGTSKERSFNQYLRQEIEKRL
jgi:hypothetical protein